MILPSLYADIVVINVSNSSSQVLEKDLMMERHKAAQKIEVFLCC